MSANPLPSEASWPPRGLSGWLVRQAGVGDCLPSDTAGRARIGLLQGWVSVVVNLVLCLVKLGLGAWIGSIALMADAVHSLSDVATSLIVVCGFYWARKPRDSRHPFGHGRIELVTALVMAVVLVVLAIEFVRFGVSRILSPRDLVVSLWMVGVICATIVLKQWLALFARQLAAATGSAALHADYWHHLADVLSTALVLVSLLATRWGWTGADGWAALGIAAFILYAGYVTARDAIHPLLGEAPPADEVRRIEETACAIPGVRGAHDVIVHKYGEDRVVSFHIEVDAADSSLQAHDLAEQAEAVVEQVIGGKAIVHVDPVDRSHPQYGAAEAMVQDVVGDHKELTAFHDLRVEGPAHHLNLSVDVVTISGLLPDSHARIETAIEEALRAQMPTLASVSVTVETGYHN